MMAFMFRCYIIGEREYFEFGDKLSGKTKKDFEFTRSLLDFLDIGAVELGALTNQMGKELQRLYSPDEEKNLSFLYEAFQKLSKEHIYFELLRLKWEERLNKYKTGEWGGDIHALLPYKEITQLPSNIDVWQKQLRKILTQALEASSAEKNLNQGMAEYYEKEKRFPFQFYPLSINFENIPDMGLTETLCPNSTHDFLDYFLRLIINKDIRFKVCRNCEKYFPDFVHGNSEFCSRFAKGMDKTCKEIGSQKLYRDKVAHSPAIRAYNRAYKTRFSRIRYQLMTKEEFRIWAVQARTLRDKVISGEWELEDFERWLRE